MKETRIRKCESGILSKSTIMLGRSKSIDDLPFINLERFQALDVPIE